MKRSAPVGVGDYVPDYKKPLMSDYDTKPIPQQPLRGEGYGAPTQPTYYPSSGGYGSQYY